MDYLAALNWRYAVNEFTTDKLNQHQIDGLAESVRLSASAYGLQPYKLLIIESDNLKQDCLPYSYGQHKVANCSHLLVLANQTQISEHDIEQYIVQLAHSQNKQAKELTPYRNIIEQDLLSQTRLQQQIWSQHQCFIALGKLLSYAALNKIDAAPMTGFDVAGINKVLKLDQQNLSAAILCPVGIRSKNDSNAKRPKYRKPLEQLVVTL